MDRILYLRNQICKNETSSTIKVNSDDSAFNFLGKTKKDKVETVLRKILPGENQEMVEARKKREKTFQYIIDFWERSLISAPYMKNLGKGLNLARYPFLSPSGKFNGDDFSFSEQYRWDTFFQNRGLILVGGYHLAINQLLNFVDVFKHYKRVPNALTTWFLSHSQPPLDMISLFDLLLAGVPKGSWLTLIVDMVEQELLTEWWDYESEKQRPRQTKKLIEKYGLLTRYNSIHFHPLLDSCEDGKDHNWTTTTYGSDYLPVQLNAIIYGIIDRLIIYYEDPDHGNNHQKTHVYKELKQKLFLDFQKTFWVNKGKWKGFRNYSIKPGKEGSIRYGDLAAEVWPLFFKIATDEQAEITKQNLEKYYKGEYGLSATSLALRKGGSIKKAPEGYDSFQWEYPNCWPPLMMIAVDGLKNYGYINEAIEYEKNWVSYVEKELERIGGFTEKQPYASHIDVSDGYYGVLKGFGWTISTYLYFSHDLALSNAIDR